MPEERLHEDCVRLVRQRLVALEDGREDDAKTLEKFIEDEFGVTLEDVELSGKSPKDEVNPADRSPEARQARLEKRWFDVYGVPEGTKMVTVLLTHAREPVFRIPTDLKGRGVSWMELPVPEDASTEGLPKHLHPRKEGKLPPRVEKAMRRQ